ncbi:hypothetical protein AB9P05_16620 [Roseivirga sp. BDSF3-8]|uniref:hypothetical protein n=1 Tax=Roseivirga sp. BDSF3-8 TaxID=3241598 RepID=UPI003531C3DC
MSLFKELSIKNLAPYDNKKLSEISDVEILKRESFEKNQKENLGDFTIAVDGGAGISINLYNEVSDLNHESKDSKLDLKTALEGGSGNYIRYSLDGKLKLSGAFKVPNVGLQANISQAITFNSYRIHKPDQEFHEAFAEDIKSFRIILSKEDVLALEDGEAVSMILNGSLSFKAEFNWTDAVTSSLTDISEILKTSDIIKLNLGANLSATASINITDNFILSIQKLDNKFVANLSRVKNNVTGLKAGFAAEAQIENPELIDEVISQAFDKGEAEVIENSNKLLDSLQKFADEKITQSKLLTEIKNNADLLQQAMELFGLDAEVDKIKEDGQKYLEEYKTKRDAVKKDISDILKAKLELSAELTYSRTKSQDTVFSATLTAAAMKKHFESLRFLNVDPLIQAFESSQSGVTLTEYKKVTKLIISRGFSIGLSIAGWKVKFDDDRIKELETEEVLQGNKVLFRVTDYSNERAVSAMEGNNFQHMGNIQFNAKMPGFVSDSGQATCDQFDYNLTLNYEEKTKDLKKNEGKLRLRNMVDIAYTFGILEEDDVETAYNDLWSKLEKQPVDFKVFLNIPYGTFESIVNDLIFLDTNALAAAASECLPYVKYDGRRTMVERRAAYTTYFKEYFNTHAGNITKDSIKRDIGRMLEQKYPSLAEFESTFEDQGVNYGDMETKALAYQLWDNNISTDFTRFKTGTLAPLARDMKLNYSKVLMVNDFRRKSIDWAVQRELTQRFIARLLINLAGKKAFTLEKGCSFTSGDNTYAYGEKVSG